MSGLLLIIVALAFYFVGREDGRRLYQIELRVAANRGKDIAEIVRSGDE